MSVKKKFSIALVVALVSCFAQAGFVDESKKSVATATPNASQPLVAPEAVLSEGNLWTATVRDKNIRTVLVRWGKQAGFRVVWDVKKDISIEADATFSGTFEDAARALLESISESDFPVEAKLYDNNVIRVVKTVHQSNAEGDAK